MHEFKLKEKELKFIYKLFPSTKEIFFSLNNLFEDRISKESYYYYLASICSRDIAYSIQCTQNSFFYALKTLFLESKYMKNDKNLIKHLIHHMRYYIDYGVISLISTQNHISSGYWHLSFKENKPLGKKYKSPSQISYSNISGIDKNSNFYDYINQICNKKEFNYLKDYRDIWLHRGIPIINGEYRFSRSDLNDKIFHDGIIGFGYNGKSQYFGNFVENSEYSLRSLIRKSSILFNYTLNQILIFIKDMEKKRIEIF